MRGAVEVQSSGDFTTLSDWALTPLFTTVQVVDPAPDAPTSITTSTGDWLAGGESGTLTIRAAGDLWIAHALGMRNDDLIDGRTWNLRLAGGADLSAANPLASLSPSFLSGKGNVTLDGSGAKVRTGTGSIEIAAGRDFVLNNSDGRGLHLGPGGGR